MKNLLMALILFLAGSLTAAHAQVDDVPEAVKESFRRQFPGASSVYYENNLINYAVNFSKDGESWWAYYTRKGVWKYTEQHWSLDKLPASVRDGFKKSKYADRAVEEVRILFKPGDIKQYRIKVAKNDIQKKNLFFNEEGRLVDDSIAF